MYIKCVNDIKQLSFNFALVNISKGNKFNVFV